MKGLVICVVCKVVSIDYLCDKCYAEWQNE